MLRFFGIIALLLLIYVAYAADQCSYRGALLGITAKYDVYKGCMVYYPKTGQYITPEEADKVMHPLLRTR